METVYVNVEETEIEFNTVCVVVDYWKEYRITKSCIEGPFTSVAAAMEAVKTDCDNGDGMQVTGYVELKHALAAKEWLKVVNLGVEDKDLHVWFIPIVADGFPHRDPIALGVKVFIADRWQKDTFEVKLQKIFTDYREPCLFIGAIYERAQCKYTQLYEE